MLAVAVLVLAAAGPVHAAWMIPPQPFRPKDFTIVKRDGVYHLFYIRHDYTLPQEQTERELGHATSVNLHDWTQQEPVLAARDTSWDRSQVWAPSLVERDGTYYLFYTGVTNEPGTYVWHQRIGLATSTDLVTWNRLDEPVFSCPQVPWVFCDSLDASTAFRDPFVMRDPGDPGRWLMYYVTFPASDPGGMVVGVATSDGDFTRWSDLKPLWITHRSWSWNAVVESPHLFLHGGLWYLFFTTNSGQPISFATGPDPIGDPAQWIYRGRLSTMLGYPTETWYASEEFSDGTHDYFAHANADRIQFHEIVWSSGWRFQLGEPAFFRVQRLRWSAPLAQEGQPVTLLMDSNGQIGQTAPIEAIQVDRDGSEHPLPLAEFGLPAEITVAGPTTSYEWIAQRVTDPADTVAGAGFVVRLTDHTAATAPLPVLPAALAGPGSGAGGEPPAPPPQPPHNSGDTPDTDPTLPGMRRPGSAALTPEGAADPEARQPALRRLASRSPGESPTFLVDLPGPAAVRLDLFDLQGRKVVTLADRELPAGATVVRWDGRRGDGMAASPGLYFARLLSRGQVWTARALLTPRR